MTRKEFKDEVRNRRGFLMSVEKELNYIYESGSSLLQDLCIHTKIMGIRRFADVASMEKSKQDAFCRWVAHNNNKPSKNQIDLYLQNNKGEKE